MKLTIAITFQPDSQEKQVINMQIDTEKMEACYLPDMVLAQKKEAIEKNSQSMQEFLSSAIQEKSNNGRARTAEAYRSTLNSFNGFMQKQPVPLVDVDSRNIEGYQSYLKNRGVCMNTISFYMRILKAAYKKAVREGMMDDRNPFERVYTGVAKTSKRALGLSQIREIKTMNLSNEWDQLARDLFLFSFYTRGMSFVDMAYLRKDDLKDGVLHYVRRKTGQHFSIKWEQQMQEITDRHPCKDNPYLLPIIKRPGACERSQYRYCQYHVNKSLANIGRQLSLPCTLTMYVARHSWANIAKSIDIPLNIISEGMGHTSEKMTSIYLKSIEESKIDMENHRIISLIDEQG